MAESYDFTAIFDTVLSFCDASALARFSQTSRSVQERCRNASAILIDNCIARVARNTALSIHNLPSVVTPLHAHCVLNGLCALCGEQWYGGIESAWGVPGHADCISSRLFPAHALERRMDTKHLLSHVRCGLMTPPNTACLCGKHEIPMVWNKVHPIVQRVWTVENYEIVHAGHIAEYLRLQREKALQEARLREEERRARFEAAKARARDRARERTRARVLARERIDRALPAHPLGRRFKTYRSIVLRIPKDIRRSMNLFNADLFLEQASFAITWKSVLRCPFSNETHPNAYPRLWVYTLLPTDERGPSAVEHRANLFQRALRLPQMYAHADFLDEFEQLVCKAEFREEQKEMEIEKTV